ncbi:glycosyltransferase family 2 protein [Paenibacillus sp. MMS20-IR301]|uniref:glycosyltransferase family A protein n=1 Tax=Paenibacillus sp. MMS20-IR301 TaxID=2895946 RepID=UPI0028EFD4DE|nr:glycosyltransferase family 2 protein [Paenibacillus sp. MMS20-IR301]WNS41979.1 glycosyltransferase family 2 protein [Paenibacillus sp. MMS20-IR301]
MQGLSVAICTRNRTQDLTRCIHSIAAQDIGRAYPVEVIIVDDGETPVPVLSEFEHLLAGCGYPMTYYSKTDRGLWLSRIKALELSSMDKILFLDDDVEIPGHYLSTLIQTYEDYPNCAGVGGIAIGMSNSFLGTVRCLLSFQQSLSSGKLSLSGQAGSMYNWHKAQKIFKTEFQHGCNMSFRTAAIRSLKPVPWLTSYSVGEDILMSRIALSSGPLYINPALKLLHHESPASRDNLEHVAYTRVLNHVHLLRDKRSGPVGYLALAWTTLYLILREQPKKNFAAIRGYKKGLKEIFGRQTAR